MTGRGSLLKRTGYVPIKLVSMLLALLNGQRTRARNAKSGDIGLCPHLRLPVKAHVGQLRQFWVYVDGAPRLPPGYEPESYWHLSWKETLIDDTCEVVFGASGEHRADILAADGSVIELQHSKIDIRDVQDRVAFYRDNTGRRVIWIVDAARFWRKSMVLGACVEGNYPIEWKPRQEWIHFLARTTDTRLFLDYRHTADKLLQVWVNKGQMWGRFQTKLHFFDSYLKSVARPDVQLDPLLFLDALGVQHAGSALAAVQR